MAICTNINREHYLTIDNRKYHHKKKFRVLIILTTKLAVYYQLRRIIQFNTDRRVYTLLYISQWYMLDHICLKMTLKPVHAPQLARAVSQLNATSPSPSNAVCDLFLMRFVTLFIVFYIELKFITLILLNYLSWNTLRRSARWRYRDFIGINVPSLLPMAVQHHVQGSNYLVSLNIPTSKSVTA